MWGTAMMLIGWVVDFFPLLPRRSASSAALQQPHPTANYKKNNEMSYKTTTVTQCSMQSTDDDVRTRLSKSQKGEDLILLSWFNGMCGGKYIEMGALDGVTYSNSYLFEAALEWDGLLVEIMPPSFQKLQTNRPFNVLVNAGVCETRQKVHYYGEAGESLVLKSHLHIYLYLILVLSGPSVSGIVEFSTESYRQRWWPHLKPDWSNAHEIDCIPLQDILNENMGSVTTDKSWHFDFFSLDVEGAELQVLRSIDFNKVSFGIIVLEADEHNERKNLVIRVFLESHGYTFLQSKMGSYWFVHQEFDQIYGHVTL